MNIKLTISYDGSRYQGWQRLKDSDKTIQGKIEEILSKLFDRTIEIDGSGRTDAGVHALGQVANFHADEKELADKLSNMFCSKTENVTTENICQKLCAYINHYLPDDIAVTKVETVSERFHSRLHASSKWYRYRVLNSDISDVFSRKYVYSLPGHINIEQMELAAEMLKGTHDFLAFSALKKVKKSTIRTIEDIRITKEGNEIWFDYVGDGFLYNMVRILTGTLLEIGMGKRSPQDIDLIFESGLRENAGYLVPAKGLCLMEVKYEKTY